MCRWPADRDMDCSQSCCIHRSAGIDKLSPETERERKRERQREVGGWMLVKIAVILDIESTLRIAASLFVLVCD